MVNWSEVLGSVVTQILRTILLVVIALVFKWAAELYLKVKEQQPDLAVILDYFVNQAVFAAEQIYRSGHGAAGVYVLRVLS